MNNEEKSVTANNWTLTVVVEPDLEDGGYIVHCPALKGCWSQGETVEEAMHNIVDAISGWLAVHLENSLDMSRLSSSLL